jgi:hypothetical protein
MARITNMRNCLLSAGAMVAVLVMASTPSQAQYWYMINGRAATYAEIQYLAANNLPSGSYWVDARGNVAQAGGKAAISGGKRGKQPGM